MSWSVPVEDLAAANTARRAISSICISEDTRFDIRGNGGPDEVFFGHGEPIKKLVDYNDAMTTITNWFSLGRTIRSITLV